MSAVWSRVNGKRLLDQTHNTVPSGPTRSLAAIAPDALLLTTLVLALGATSLIGQTNAPPASGNGSSDVRGKPISKVVNPPPATAGATNEARRLLLDAPDAKDGSFLVLSFEKLSAFDYHVTAFPSLLEPDRMTLRSTNSIPPQITAYDGRRVSVTGFVLPLRLKNRLVSEFLLLRDQGSCCFGKAAQMNHFIRVRLKGPPISAEPAVPHTVRGTLRVGESFVGEDLSNIYTMDAEVVTAQSLKKPELP